MRWKKVSLIGVGLLGGSLGMALRERKHAAAVVGYVRRRASIRECEDAGAVDRATLSLKVAVKQADLVVLCTPLRQMKALFREMIPHLKPGTIVTDVGSVKGSLLRDLNPLAARGGVHFIGSHPMAGSEKTGVRSARSDLYNGAVCVITPGPNSDPSVAGRIQDLWKSVGSRVITLDPDLHDEFVSRTSHLPHLVAACLSKMVLDPRYPTVQSALCANGFKDCTRVASGSPEMWLDIALTNRAQIAAALEKFTTELETLRSMVRRGSAREIQEFLETAKSRRDAWQSSITSNSME